MRKIRTVFLLLPTLACAQEYRATILGLVTDPSGAAVVDALVKATNLETRVTANSRTNQEGSYVIPYLLPGRYGLQVEQAGFKTFERRPIELRMNDRARLDVTLQLGLVSDHVTVISESPLLELSSSSGGQSLEARSIAELPVNGRNPLALVALAAGVQWGAPGSTGGRIDETGNGQMATFLINGGSLSTNEAQIDGVSNHAISTGLAAVGSQTPAYSPPLEAVRELRILANTYDAQYGRTGGGVISISIKPGTNTFHGSVYEHLRRTGLEANTFANNAAGQPRGSKAEDQYGFEVDGPVVLPKLYQGKDRTFFMFSADKWRTANPASSLGSVPTAEQRKGDFSQTFAAPGRLYTIYDPLTIQPNPAFTPSKPVTLSNLQYLRTPFPGNRMPQDRLNAVAQHVLGDIPLPNQTGDPVTHMNNWYVGDVMSRVDVPNLIARVDHNISSAWRIYARWNYNFRDGGRLNRDGWETPARRQVHLTRRNDGAVFDALGALSPRTVVNMRVGFNRFKEFTLFTPQDVSSLGFPKSLANQLQMPNKYPMFQFTDYMQTSQDETNILTSDNYTAQGNVLKIVGKHSIKFGSEVRLMRHAMVGRKNGMGTYIFTRSWTSSNPQVTDVNSGNAIASFLLGYMDSASATINATPYLSAKYPVLFYHDDWQVSRRLTLNLGLRWDVEGTPVERYDRQDRGFDFNARSPYQAPGLDLRGGLLFAGVGGQPRGAFDTDWNNVQPRAGLAYKVLANRPLVFRGGVGRYFQPTVEFGGTMGFAQTTNAQTSTAGFQPFHTLSDPYPNGLIQPAGASGGLATQVGDVADFSDPLRKVPNVWQYSAGFQYEPVSGLLVDASYVGSQTKQLQMNREMSYLSLEQLKLGTQYLSQAVSNPFYGVLPLNTSRGAQATIQRRNLLTQFPQFASVLMRSQSLGESWYNSLQMKVAQRFKHGVSYQISYTISKLMNTAFYNPQDTKLARDIAQADTPQRLVVSGLYEFPIGPGKKWISHGIASHLIGGWQFGWIATVQSGTPISYPDYYINGNPKLESGQTLNHWFNTSKEIWVPRPPDTLRVTPSRSPNIRRHSPPQLDANLTRMFRIREGQSVQFKVLAYNATNTPIFGFPNTNPASPLFGVVPLTQLNLPRSMELGFRYVF